jgi:hypothetical protein
MDFLCTMEPDCQDVAIKLDTPLAFDACRARPDREYRKMTKLWPFERLIVSFKEAFGLRSPPPLCFYLEGRPFLEEPCRMLTPQLGYVYLLNGVTFHDDADLGCQMCIEDQPGLIAAVRAARSPGDKRANIEAITRWRLCCSDDQIPSAPHRNCGVPIFGSQARGI